MESSPLRRLPAEVRGLIWDMVFQAHRLKQDNEVAVEVLRTDPGRISTAQITCPVPGGLAISETCNIIREESLYALFFKAKLVLSLYLKADAHNETRSDGSYALEAVHAFKAWLRSVPCAEFVGQLFITAHGFNPVRLPDFALWTTLDHLLPSIETRTLLPHLTHSINVRIEICADFIWEAIVPCDNHMDDANFTWDSCVQCLHEPAFCLPIGDKADAETAADDMIQRIAAAVDKALQRRLPNCPPRSNIHHGPFDFCTANFDEDAAEDMKLSLIGELHITAEQPEQEGDDELQTQGSFASNS